MLTPSHKGKEIRGEKIRIVRPVHLFFASNVLVSLFLISHFIHIYVYGWVLHMGRGAEIERDNIESLCDFSFPNLSLPVSRICVTHLSPRCVIRNRAKIRKQNKYKEKATIGSVRRKKEVAAIRNWTHGSYDQKNTGSKGEFGFAAPITSDFKILFARMYAFLIRLHSNISHQY